MARLLHTRRHQPPSARRLSTKTAGPFPDVTGPTRSAARTSGVNRPCPSHARRSVRTPPRRVRSIATSRSRRSVGRRRSFTAFSRRETKSGRSTGHVPEIPAEAAATRLLAALGFGADTITLVERLRCFGCPRDPFLTMKVVETTGARPVYERVVDHDALRRVRMGGGREEVRGAADRDRGTEGVGVLRAGYGRRSRRAAPARARRCAAADRGVPRALGQQGREPAAGLPVEPLGTRHAVPRAVSDAPGCRRDVRSEESRSRRVGAGGHLGGPCGVQGLDEGACLTRRHVRHGAGVRIAAVSF